MTAAAPLRVLIVDDHAAIRVGVASLIDAEQPSLCSAGAAATPAEALALASRVQPDVVVLDVDLDGADGLALIPALQAAAPCSIVVLTSLQDVATRDRALRLGAAALVRKDEPAAVLLAQIRLAPMQSTLTRPAGMGSAMSRSLRDE